MTWYLYSGSQTETVVGDVMVNAFGALRASLDDSRLTGDVADSRLVAALADDRLHARLLDQAPVGSVIDQVLKARLP